MSFAFTSSDFPRGLIGLVESADVLRPCIRCQSIHLLTLAKNPGVLCDV